jgi:hypothetical protein
MTVLGDRGTIERPRGGDMTDIGECARLMTAEELFAMPGHGGDFELVNGELRASGQLRLGEPPNFWHGFDGAPDLAAEIVSPGDSAAEIAEKVEDYLASGVRLVWIVYPRSRHVVVWTPDGAARTLRGDDALDGADVVPGFRLPLAELFASLPNAAAPRA